MHSEIEAKLEPVKKMKERLVEWCECEIAKGKEGIDTKELGEAIDMIKDLAEAEQLCWSACYYKSVTEAMEESSQMGYNPNRSSTTGRYMRGYNPMSAMMEETPYIDRYLEDPQMFGTAMRMGYNMSQSGSSMRPSMSGYSASGSGSGSSGGSLGSSSGGSSGYTPDQMMSREDMRYNEPFREWKKARRHYTETGSQADKQEMGTYANEHVTQTIATMREIWKMADPEQKKRMKQDLQNLIGELTV